MANITGDYFSPLGFFNFDHDNGVVGTSLGENQLVLPRSFFSGLMRAMMQPNQGGSDMLYQAGISWGKDHCGAIAKVHAASGAGEISELDSAIFNDALSSYVAAIGFGKLSFEPTGGLFTYNLTSAVATSDNLGSAVCQILCGFIAGLFSELSNSDVSAVRLPKAGDNGQVILLGEQEVCDNARRMAIGGKTADDVLGALQSATG